MEKIKLLITYQHVHIGGATTSLINFLHALNPQRYDVDLLFYENDHSIDDKIPSYINILPQGKIHKKFSISNLSKKIFSPSYMWAKLREIYVRKIKGNDKAGIQIISKQGCRYSRRIEKEYDIAAAYDMNWPFNYIMKYIKAKRYILWMHLDFDAAGLSFKTDRKFLQKVDRLIFVSEECRDNFIKAHEGFALKSIYMPNLMSTKTVRALAQEEAPDFPPKRENGTLTMITVARIDFPHKGTDRGIKAMAELKNRGKKLKWIIIGGGPDEENLKLLIEDYGLEGMIYYLGEKKNPIPYLKECDIFFLPSLFEGKPMAVTEAQMMGLVPVVCRYASAPEQIEHGVDGIILDNSLEGIFSGLEYITENTEAIRKMKDAVARKNYSNEHEIKIFDELTEDIL